MERQRKLVREQLFSEQLYLTKSSLIYQSVSRLISPDLGEPQKILSDPHLLLFLGGGAISHHVALAVLKVAMYTTLASNSQLLG